MAKMAFLVCQSARTFSTICRKSVTVNFLSATHFPSTVPSPASPANHRSGNVAMCPMQIRHGSFDTSPMIDQIDAAKLPQIEILRNPPEWKFVEHLLPAATVPTPTIKKEYPSGWRPQTIDPSQSKYFIRRNKNHMVPVYLSITFRGTRRVTELMKIEGDIWALAEELRDFLEDYTDRKMAIRVQEFSGQIWIKGDYVNLIKGYLMDKGF